jgi:GH24 family phage-related lysozyme (muramidase)
MQQLSAAGLHQLVQDEGGFRYYRTVTLPNGTKAKRWVPYNDSKGYCTVGHGHLIAYHNCTPAEIAKWTLTNAQAEAWLLHDAQSRVETVNRLVKRGLTQAQFDALVNFVYNAGAGRAPFRDKHGRLRKLGLIGAGILAAVNAGDDHRAGELILSYISRQERLTSKGLCQWPSVSPHWWPLNSPLVAIISPRWWPSNLPTGGHRFSPAGGWIVSQVRGFTPLPAVAWASR